MAKTLDDPDRRHNSPFLSKEQYDAILGTVCNWATLTREARKALGSKAYAWVKKYSVITASGETQLVFANAKVADDGTTDSLAPDLVAPSPANAAGTTDAEAAPAAMGLDQLAVVSHRERVFDDLLSIHDRGAYG